MVTLKMPFQRSSACSSTSFFQLFSKHLWRFLYTRPFYDSMLGPEETAVNKADPTPALKQLSLKKTDTKINKPNRYQVQVEQCEAVIRKSSRCFET